MNWNKAKTILIIFFLVINIFLFYNLVAQNKNDNRINDETVSNTVKVLENNGIGIDKKLISKNNISLETFEADNIITDYEEFAKKILGDECNKISDTLYTGTNGRVEYFGDQFVVLFRTQNYFSVSEENCINLLKQLGLSISDYEYKNGTFKKNVGGIEVFSSTIRFKKKNDGFFEISGIWFENNSDSISFETKLKPVTSVLIDYISAKDRPKGNVNISNLKLGYMVYETESYHKSIVPIPVWQIKLSDGNCIYMDARSVE